MSELSGSVYLVVEVVTSRYSGQPIALRVAGMYRRRPKARAGQVVVDLTVRAPSPAWAVPVVIDVGQIAAPPGAISVEGHATQPEGGEREGQ